MMLMTKFGKFKLRLIATINLSVLLTLFNIASTTTNYWTKYIDSSSGETHYAGMWRSCPNQGSCLWKNGIIDNMHSFWSICVRFLITLGTVANVVVFLLFAMALIYKINKKTRCVIKLLEWGNTLLIMSFVVLMIGVCFFISSSCHYSLFFQILTFIFMMITSNMITRKFGSLYFRNTRNGPSSKSVETAISHSKLACDPEEKIALAPMSKDAITSTEQCCGSANNAAPAIIEMSKVSEATGSNEALIPASVCTTNETNTNNTPSIAVMDVNTNNQESSAAAAAIVNA